MNKERKPDRSILKDIFYKTPCLTYKQLKAYHQNQSNGNERFKIENHLIDCQLCSDALEGLALSESDSISRRDLSSLRETWHSRFGFNDIRHTTWKPYLAMAAIVLLAFVTVLSLLKPNSTEEILFLKYFRPYPNTIPLIRGDEPQSIMENAMIEYEAENYQNASSILSDILTNNPDHSAANFYMGLIHLIHNRTAVAVPHFKKVITDGSNDYIEPAAWYLGLAYLRNDDIKRAKEIIRNIAGKDGSYQEHAINLIKKLE